MNSCGFWSKPFSVGSVGDNHKEVTESREEGEKATDEERRREEVFDEPELDGAVGVAHDRDGHDEREPLPDNEKERDSQD